MPRDLPQWVRNLTVTGNNIATLITGAFAANETSFQLLSTLSLYDNNIERIAASAFGGLPNLKSLDLSYNPLLYISIEAFNGLYELRNLCLNSSLSSSGVRVSNALSSSGLRKLKRLELSGNQMESVASIPFETLSLDVLILTNNSIQTVERDVVSKWMNRKTMHVYLESNPFTCDCSYIESLYTWLKNSSQCLDAGRLKCTEPESKKGTPLLSLKMEDLACGNPDLETVSYVFLGIVLALIGVIFLMVLYLNREGIKRWLNNIREACRDQMEVYHYRYEQDSDPRLANVAIA
ncbi:TPBGL protein, partial [Amia calva]|nr:TPBGL protein [Amia calva]